MKKWRFILVTLLSFILCGCMQINVKYVIEEDGKVKLGGTYLIQDSFIEQYDVSMDDLKESIANDGSDLSEDDYTFKEITKTIDDVKYQGIEFMSNTAIEMPDDDTINLDIKNGKAAFTMDTTSLTSDIQDSGYDKDSLEAMGFKMTFTIEMPYPIKEASEGEIDGNSVTINLLDINNQKITITAEKDSSTLLYIGIGIGIAAIALSSFIIIKKRKKAPEPSDKQKENNETINNNEVDNDEL